MTTVKSRFYKFQSNILKNVKLLHLIRLQSIQITSERNSKFSPSFHFQEMLRRLLPNLRNFNVPLGNSHVIMHWHYFLPMPSLLSHLTLMPFFFSARTRFSFGWNFLFNEITFPMKEKREERVVAKVTEINRQKYPL